MKPSVFFSYMEQEFGIPLPELINRVDIEQIIRAPTVRRAINVHEDPVWWNKAGAYMSEEDLIIRGERYET